MSNGKQPSLRFEELSSKPVVVSFTASGQSSEGGLPLLARVDRRLGLTARLAGALHEQRAGARIAHDLPELVRQRVFSIALGCADGNSAARMGADPLVKLACGRSPASGDSLASQPTLSRFERGRSGRELVGMARALTDLCVG